MGYYTCIKFSAVLRPDTPEQVIHFFHAIASRNNESMDRFKPPHVFFETARWDEFFTGGDKDAYWPEAHGQLKIESQDDGSTKIEFHNVCKNYDHLLEKFCDWISSLMSTAPGQVVGEYQGEDDVYQRGPHLLIAQEGRIDKLESLERESTFYF